MRLEITAQTTNGPVVHSAEVATLRDAERAVQGVLRQAMGTWSPDHAAGLRAIMRDLDRSGSHRSKSLTVTLS